jgi:hypothetical protein
MPTNHDLKIEIIDDQGLARVYANYLSVTTAPHECNLTFCHIDPLKKSQSRLDAKVVAKVMISNTLVEEMINVIKTNFTKTMNKMAQPEQK